MSAETYTDRLTEAQAVRLTAERLEATFNSLSEYRVARRSPKERLRVHNNFGWGHYPDPNASQAEQEEEKGRILKGRILNFDIRRDKDGKNISYAMIQGQLPATPAEGLENHDICRSDIWCARILMPPNRYLDSPARAMLDTWILPTTQTVTPNLGDTSLRWDKAEAIDKINLLENLILRGRPDVAPLGALAVKHTKMRAEQEMRLVNEDIEENLREVLDKFDQGASDYIQRLDDDYSLDVEPVIADRS